MFDAVGHILHEAVVQRLALTLQGDPAFQHLSQLFASCMDIRVEAYGDGSHVGHLDPIDLCHTVTGEHIGQLERRAVSRLIFVDGDDGLLRAGGRDDLLRIGYERNTAGHHAGVRGRLPTDQRRQGQQPRRVLLRAVFLSAGRVYVIIRRDGRPI